MFEYTLLQKHCLEDFNIDGKWILISKTEISQISRVSLDHPSPAPIQSSLDDHVTSLTQGLLHRVVERRVKSVGTRWVRCTEFKDILCYLISNQLFAAKYALKTFQIDIFFFINVN